MVEKKKSKQELDIEKRKDKKGIKEKLEEKQEKKDDDIGFRQWIIKTVMIGVILLLVVCAVEYFFHVQIVTDTILAVTIVLCMGFTHEALHYGKAVSLGYVPKWYRTRVMMGFEIKDSPDKRLREKHKKQIGHAPYPVIMPISIAILLLGFYFNNLGLFVAGLTSIILHGIAFPLEGRN